MKSVTENKITGYKQMKRELVTWEIGQKKISK